MNKEKAKTAAEISARISEIGEHFARSVIAETLPDFRALKDEQDQLRAEYGEALKRESLPPSEEHLRQVREADERRARVSRALIEATQ